MSGMSAARRVSHAGVAKTPATDNSRRNLRALEISLGTDVSQAVPVETGIPAPGYTIPPPADHPPLPSTLEQVHIWPTVGLVVNLRDAKDGLLAAFTAWSNQSFKVGLPLRVMVRAASPGVMVSTRSAVIALPTSESHIVRLCRVGDT